MAAVRSALDSEDENAIDFVDNVNKFLGYFGMNGDRADLTQRAEKAALSVAVGSQAWYLARSNGGEQLLQAGQPQRAMRIFQEILVGLGETVSYQRCLTLSRLGRCWEAMGQPAQAATLYRQTLAELGQLESSDGVKRQMGATQTDLADVLCDVADYGAARKAYEESLAIIEKLDDKRSVGAINAQLGALAMREGNLGEAQTRYQSALTTFRTLDEPLVEAGIHYQLGRMHQKSRAWELAEQSYREAARIREAQGCISGNDGVAMIWNQLAIVRQLSGRPREAEAWFRKAIEASKSVGDIVQTSRSLNNLADLLQTQGDLPEARKLAEESLTLKQTLDPDAAEIWSTYEILADIVTQQGEEAAKAKDYRL